MTHDRWHLTYDTFLVMNIVSKLRSLALTVWELSCFEDLEEKDELLNVFVEQPLLYRLLMKYLSFVLSRVWSFVKV